MKVEVKYKEGDIVRFKRKENITTSCTCTFCGGSGQVIGLDGTRDDCPRCEGRGYTEESHEEEIIEESMICNIHVKFDNKAQKYNVFYNMSEWQLSQLDVPQEDIIEKTGRWEPNQAQRELGITTYS